MGQKVPDEKKATIVSTSNLLVTVQNDDTHHRTMITNDAVIDNLVLLHYSNLPLDLKWIRLMDYMKCTTLDCLLIEISIVLSGTILSGTDIRVFDNYQHGNDNMADIVRCLIYSIIDPLLCLMIVNFTNYTTTLLHLGVPSQLLTSKLSFRIFFPIGFYPISINI